MIPQVLLWICVGWAMLAVGYSLIAGLVLAKWRNEDVPASGATPPVTLLRPIKRATPRLIETLDSLASAARADDQIVLGVDADGETARLCEEWRTQNSDREIAVIHCSSRAALNPKISKLIQMSPHARCEHWIVTDSEALLDAEFLAAFRAEWEASHADVLTAPYRFVKLETWPQRLDAAAVLLTLWPGLAVLRSRGGVRLTLGACTALRRGDLDSVGGWAAFGADLADDNRLGAALANAGCMVRLSAHIATLLGDALSWRDYWRHQRRVAVTYRVANPAGFAGAIVTLGILPALLALVLPYRLAPALAAMLAAWVCGQRWLAARNAARSGAFPIPLLAFVVPLASLVEAACWLLAWCSRRVWWAGKWWRVSRDGKLGEANAECPAAVKCR
jgi:ceramide glucosyltransferase